MLGVSYESPVASSNHSETVLSFVIDNPYPILRVLGNPYQTIYSSVNLRIWVKAAVICMVRYKDIAHNYLKSVVIKVVPRSYCLLYYYCVVRYVARVMPIICTITARLQCIRFESPRKIVYT